MSVMNRKLFNRGARDELRRKGGIMASSEPMMQAAGYENGGQITREDILRFLAQGPVFRNPSNARKTIDTLLYPARYSGQDQSGYTYNRPPYIDSPMTVSTKGPSGVISQSRPEKYYRGLVRDGVQEGSQLSSLLGSPDPGEVGSLTGRFGRPLSEIIDATAYSSLFGDKGSVARDLALRAAKFLESDTSVPREQIYGANPQVTGSDTAFETISTEPPSYLYVNIPGVTPDPVLMTERDFERFENLYPDATQATDTTVIDVESLPSQVDISTLSIVTSLDPVGLSRKQAIEKTSQKQEAIDTGIIPEVNIAKSSKDQAEIERLTEEAADAEKKAAALETELAIDSSTPESVALAERRQMLGFPEISPSVRDDAFVAGLDENFPVGDRADAPEKPKFPTLDQFIEVQGGKDKRETFQKNADELLDDATKDLGGAKTGDAFDDVFDKYVSRFSEILGDDEEEKKKNTGFALAMYGATYAATGDAGQAAMTMIETLRGDAATRQERKDKIKMLALQAATDKEARDDALQAKLADEKRSEDRQLRIYEAKIKIKEKYDDPTGYLDTDLGKYVSGIYSDVLTDDTLNEDEKGEAFIGRVGEANANTFYNRLGIPRLGVKQGGGKGSDWFNQ